MDVVPKGEKKGGPKQQTAVGSRSGGKPGKRWRAKLRVSRIGGSAVSVTSVRLPIGRESNVIESSPPGKKDAARTEKDAITPWYTHFFQSIVLPFRHFLELQGTIQNAASAA